MQLIPAFALALLGSTTAALAQDDTGPATYEDIGINCGTTVTCSGSMNSHSIDLGYAISL